MQEAECKRERCGLAHQKWLHQAGWYMGLGPIGRPHRCEGINSRRMLHTFNAPCLWFLTAAAHQNHLGSFSKWLMEYCIPKQLSSLFRSHPFIEKTQTWTKCILKMCVNIWNYQEGKNLEGQDQMRRKSRSHDQTFGAIFFPQEDWLPVSKSVPERLKS